MNIIKYIQSKKLQQLSYGELFKSNHMIFKETLKREYLLNEKPLPKVILSKRASWIWKNLTSNKYCWWFSDKHMFANKFLVDYPTRIVDIEFGTFEEPYVKFVSDDT